MKESDHVEIIDTLTSSGGSRSPVQRNDYNCDACSFAGAAHECKRNKARFALEERDQLHEAFQSSSLQLKGL